MWLLEPPGMLAALCVCQQALHQQVLVAALPLQVVRAKRVV
jgi:hypothetical protein